MEKDTLLIGRKPVVEALESSTMLEKVWIDNAIRGELEKEIRRLCRDHKVPLQYVPKQKLSTLVSNANHQGLVAQVSLVHYCTIEALIPKLYEEGRVPFILVLDGVEDVRNLGALARSAVWFDLDAIVIPSKRSASINSFAYKTSAGAIKDIQICRETNFEEALNYMKNSGLQLIIAEANSDLSHKKIAFEEPLALVLGSEGKGVTREIRKLADAALSIPGSGRVESLNVSVAGAILMSEIFKLRQK